MMMMTCAMLKPKRLISIGLMCCALAGTGGCGPGEAPGRPSAGSAGGTPDAGEDDPREPDMPTVRENPLVSCQDSDAAFVRRAYLAALGRRPRSQDEVRFYTDLIRQVDEGAPLAEGAPLSAGRHYAVLAMINASQVDYLRRWTDFYMDSLRIRRDKSPCLLAQVHPEPERVAERVRREPARNQIDDFTLLDLMLGALKLDDVSPIYIGNLFTIVRETFAGANADPIALELARRKNFGARFSGTYLHRDIVCLRCHNSESSVTFDADPAKNRSFPLPGLLEKSLFTDSSGPPQKDGHDGIARAFGLFRYDGFVVPMIPWLAGDPISPIPLPNAPLRPWGWDASCGQFYANVGEDPAGVDTLFGSVRGTRVSLWDLSLALQRGFLGLREHGLPRGGGGELPASDETFAYLVSAHIAEEVWREIIGTQLTIANYFPRNAASRDELLRITEAFVASGFSHINLLLEVFRSPAFNLQSPERGCSEEPYAFPAIFDPWVIADSDPARRKNSVGDAIASLSSRTMLSAAYGALGWARPNLDSLRGEGGEEGFLSTIGVFIGDGHPGFRGLDFQSRLAWENRVAMCDVSPEGDFIDQLFATATEHTDAKVSDLVAALKDRIVGDPRLADMEERRALEALLGHPLDAELATIERAVIEGKLRSVCGALLESPQFMLNALVPHTVEATPKLTPPGATYQDACEQLEARASIDGYRVECTSSGVRLQRE